MLAAILQLEPLFCCFWLSVASLINAVQPSSLPQDSVTIVLRDLTTIRCQSIDFDDYRITTSDGKTIFWDSVVSGSLGPETEQQQEFDQVLQTVGRPLFHLRHRLNIGDHKALLTLAEPLYQSQTELQSTDTNIRHKFIVALGCFHGRLANGKRSPALAPLFEINRLLKKHPELRSAVNESVLATLDPKTGFANNLVPIWFDAWQAKLTLSKLNFAELGTPELQQLPDAHLVYLASLATTASDTKLTKTFTDELTNRRSLFTQDWLTVILAQQKSKQAISKLQQNYQALDGAIRAAANFTLANSQPAQPRPIDDVLLDLMYIPANYSSQLPGLSAAAIHKAQSMLKSESRFEEARILHNTLKQKCKLTYHERLLPKQFETK